MKIRYLVAAVAAAFAGAASAQQAGPQVGFYGVLDAFGEYNSGGQDGSRFAVQSGGVAGSRLGVRISQDLGGGLKVIGRAEAGVGADTGTSTQGGRVFGRQVFAGFGGNFGTVTFGRQYTPYFLLADSTDPFGTGYGSAFNTGVMSLASRVNSSIVYESPNFSGFVGRAMLGAGETNGETGGNLVSLGGDFTAGNLFVGLAYVQDKRVGGTTGGEENFVAGSDDATAMLLGATYSLGAFKLYGGYAQTSADLIGPPATSVDRDEYQFGVSWAFSPKWTAAFGYGSSKVDNVADSTGTIYTLGLTYAMAKNLNLYGIYSKHSNDSNVGYGPSGASSTNDYAFLDGQDPSGIAVGFTFRF
jgi:predicted porin